MKTGYKTDHRETASQDAKTDSYILWAGLSTAGLGFLILALALAGSSRPPSAAHAFPATAVAVSKPVQNEVVNWSEFTGRTAAVNLVSVTARGYLIKAFIRRKKIQANLREPWRIMAEDGGHFMTLFVSYLCKFFIISYLEARGIEPLYPPGLREQPYFPS
jgi:hypothetical protein